MNKCSFFKINFPISLLSNLSQIEFKKQKTTGMHSSRMRTAHFLTVSHAVWGPTPLNADTPLIEVR